MAYEKPLPKVNADTERFWEGCRTHELRFQQCSTCGHVRFPPSVLCPQCHARELTWIAAGGTGKIYTYAIYHVAYYPGFLGEIPYVVAVVELDEGPRMLTNIVGAPRQTCTVRCLSRYSGRMSHLRSVCPSSPRDCRNRETGGETFSYTGCRNPEFTPLRRPAFCQGLQRTA